MLTVLLVEDEMVIALGTTMILEDAGYSVVHAANGEAGLKKALEINPNLIITDYMMPRMDGLAMIEAIRACGMAVPIILATSVPEANVRRSTPSAFDAYLGKPYSEPALLETIMRLCPKFD
jgi:CheY-like chemotaxis protein